MLPFSWNVHHAALVHPTDNAVVVNGLSVSYGSLSQLINAVAQSLNELGISSGDRMALVASKNIYSVSTILGALQAGVVVVPINPLLKSAQLGFIVNNCSAVILLCSQTQYAALMQEGVKLPSLKIVVLVPEAVAPDNSKAAANESKQPDNHTILMEWTSFTRRAPSDSTENNLARISIEPTDDIAAILYTSGSTGMPKGVALTRSNLHYGAVSVSTYLEISAQDRILGMMPLSFDYGLNQLTTAMHTGACLVLHDYRFPKSVIDMIREHRITGLPAVPHVWDQLMAIQWPEVPHLRYATSTGGSLQEPTIKSISTRLPHTRLYSMYGFTEAFRATYLPPSELKARPKSIGKAVPHAKVMVVDSEGREQPPYKIGELIQSGPLVSAGYWRDLEGTQQKFRTRPAYADDKIVYAWSGDLCHTDEEGYLYFVSRRDDQVKLNGHRTSPSEIERTLVQCEWIQEACILCVPHSRFGHVAIAFVVTNNKVDANDLTNWCRRELPSYLVPDKWYFVANLPTSPNNKIDRHTLLQQHLEASHAS